MSNANFRRANRFGDLIGDLLRYALIASTALLPTNGRDHVRARALAQLGGKSKSVEVAGIRLDLEWGALLAANPLRWLEEETIVWLDTIVADGDVVWDIGANVGLYALWCAKRHPKASVFAFEPNVLTFPFLARHAISNGLSDRVVPLPFALADAGPEIATFRLSTLLPGWAGNQLELADAPKMWFDREEGRFPVPAGSVDNLIEIYGLPTPDHIKLDVDGIEPTILAGAKRALRRVSSVLVEVWGQEEAGRIEQSTAIAALLSEAGLDEDVSFGARGSGLNRLFRRGRPSSHLVCQSDAR